MRPFNKKFSVFDPNLQIGADTKKTADGDNNIQKAEFEQVIRSSGQTPGASISITSLTQTAGLATAVTAAPHGFINGQWVDIFGVDAVPYELLVYNGIQQATVTAPDTFTFPILPGTPSPATGTIGAYHSQIDKAIANYTASQFSWKEAAGSVADFYVLERVGIPTLTAPAAYYEGALFQFEVVNTNTGIFFVTITIPVLGVVSVLDLKGFSLTAGALTAGNVVTLRYDGTDLILIDGYPQRYDSAYLASGDGPETLGAWALYPAMPTITIRTIKNPIILSLNIGRWVSVNANSRLAIDDSALPLTPAGGMEMPGLNNQEIPGATLRFILAIPPGSQKTYRVIYSAATTGGTPSLATADISFSVQEM